MAISQAMQDALNEQVKYELESAYVYLSMSAYCETLTLPGFASWMRAQANEELEHALKIFDFINERGGQVTLHSIDQPPASYESVEAVFAKALAHEEMISGRIHKLYALAQQQNDYPSEVMLHWFITEQVEEEQNVGQMLDMVRKAEGRDWALLILDRQATKRED
jgi:ferritin